jgi:hypothetical protein
MAVLRVGSRRLPETAADVSVLSVIFKLLLRPIAQIFWVEAEHWVALGSRLLPPYRAAILQSGSPPGDTDLPPDKAAPLQALTPLRALTMLRVLARCNRSYKRNLI